VRALGLPRRDWPLVVAGGLLLPLAYPPFHLFVPSFVCLVPVVWLVLDGAADERPLRRHLVQGFWFGFLSNALVLYWMIVALWHFTPLSALGYLATVAVLALWSAVLFALVGWVRRRTPIGMLLVFPILWTAVEWATGHQGDIRFPWLGLGTSLTHYPMVVQIADVVGARGVTFLLALANTALALAWRERARAKRAWRLAGGVVLGVLLVTAYGAVRMRTLVLRPLGRVAVIQPDIGFDTKWTANPERIVDSLLRLSDSAIVETHPDLAVWPEAAVPGYFFQHRDWQVRIEAQAAQTRTPLVIGGLDATPLPSGGWDIFNAAFVYGADGRPAPEPPYHKHYLVPIVERVPFVNPHWFRALRFFGAFAVGDRGPVYQLPVGRFGILICYESIFEDLSRRYRRLGADFLINITNDAWYGNTSAAYQHPAHLVMRAIETRVGIARAGNDGISEFVDPLGREHQRTRKGTRTFEAGDVYTTDAHTIYVVLGDWVGLLTVVGTLAMIGAAWWRKP
jgi:apolipoprotein N-acyltransferase